MQSYQKMIQKMNLSCYQIPKLDPKPPELEVDDLLPVEKLFSDSLLEDNTFVKVDPTGVETVFLFLLWNILTSFSKKIGSKSEEGYCIT